MLAGESTNEEEPYWGFEKSILSFTGWKQKYWQELYQLWLDVVEKL